MNNGAQITPRIRSALATPRDEAIVAPASAGSIWAMRFTSGGCVDNHSPMVSPAGLEARSLRHEGPGIDAPAERAACGENGEAQH